MGGVRRFEDLIAWQRARELTTATYQATCKGSFGHDFGLARQMQRAAVSIMSNVAEGFERHSPADFRRFLMIAKASCAELRSQFYVALDIGYISQEEFNRLMKQANEVARLISGLHASIARQNRSQTPSRA